MGAAASVGYAARPLPLYYAMSQAGRAIAAAHADQPWKLKGHGLRHESGHSIFQSVITLEPDCTDLFSHVCGAVSQDLLTESVELGALWASLPEFWGIELRRERWPRALRVMPPSLDFAANRLRNAAAPAVICGLPDRIFEGVSDKDLPAVLEKELAQYPGAQGWEPSAEVPHADEWGRHANVRWNADSSWLRGVVLDQHAPEYRVREQRWLRPVLNESNDVLGPLMTWWALLYGLSMLARYDPAPWTEALRADKSRDAVPLEIAMDEALEAVPHLVLEALKGKRLLLRTPG